MAVAESEGGFGSGLRAKLAKETDDPRSPGEAIAAADESSPDVDLLRAELTASLAREQGLECYALSVAYGQRHGVELDAAVAVARALGCGQHLAVVH